MVLSRHGNFAATLPTSDRLQASFLHRQQRARTQEAELMSEFSALGPAAASSAFASNGFGSLLASSEPRGLEEDEQEASDEVLPGDCREHAC